MRWVKNCFFKVTGMGLSNCLSEAFQLIIENYKQDTRLTIICYVKKSSVCHVISILVQYITVKNLFQADFSICSLNINKQISAFVTFKFKRGSWIFFTTFKNINNIWHEPYLHNTEFWVLYLTYNSTSDAQKCHTQSL